MRSSTSISTSDVKSSECSRYSIYRRVVGYYNDDPTGRSTEGEDAFDMRKPLSRDKSRKYIRENGEDFKVNPEDVW